MFPFHLVQSANTEFLLTKTNRALNRSSKCANVRYRKSQVCLWFYHYFITKTKKIYHTTLEIFTKNNSLCSLITFHGGLFELEILKIFITILLLNSITWTWYFFQAPLRDLLKNEEKLLKKDASCLKIVWRSKKQKKIIKKRERETKNEKKSKNSS